MFFNQRVPEELNQIRLVRLANVRMRSMLLLAATCHGLAVPSLTASECVSSFLALDPPFHAQSFELYDQWFDDNSTLRVAQTGIYKGADAIREYIGIGYSTSNYISTLGTFRSDPSFVSFDPKKRSCIMLVKYYGRVQMSEMAGKELFEGTKFYQLEWRFDDQKLGDVNVYCVPPPPHRCPTALC